MEFNFARSWCNFCAFDFCVKGNAKSETDLNAEESRKTLKMKRMKQTGGEKKDPETKHA